MAVLNFDGGLRDFFVGEAYAKNFTSSDPNYALFRLESIKNVQSSLNHNSQLYSRQWLNTLVPVISKVALLSTQDVAANTPNLRISVAR